MELNEWCNNIKCRKYHSDFEVIKIKKNQKGLYYPYRDTMDPEQYTYTEITLKCRICGEKIKTEEDKDYEMSKSRFEKYGRHSHHGT